MAQPRRNDFLIPTMGVLFDSIAIEVSFLLAYWLRFRTSFFEFLPLTEDTPPLDAYILGSIIIIPIWLMLFNSRKMYGARRNIAIVDDLFTVVKVVTIGMLIVMSVAFFYRAFSYSRVVFGLLWLTSIVSILFGRIFIVQIEKSMYRRGHDLRNAVIIGDNEAANRIYRALNNHPLLGYKLIGYFADTLSPIGEPLHKSTLLGTIQDAPKKLIKNNVELALISLNSSDHMKLHQLVQGCEGIDVEFMMVPDILELMASPDHVRIRELEGIPFIKIKGIPMTTWGRISKRAFDVTTSSILLLLFSPILLLIAVAIKLESKGSPLFRQDRLGMDGKSFSMLKFRSMKAGAEQLDHQSGLGITDDPRQTRVGKFLRRLSLDELPQLINVLKGEMSLVGPRPERPYYVDQFKSVIPKYLDRHRVKTGMTGWAQVNGFRGNSSLEERVKYDIYYIENWSLWFDIKILLKTIRALF